MSEVIVNKIVRISGEDRLTSVIARTNQAMENLQQHMSALGMKFSSGATDTASFRTSLSDVKANANQTDESLNKLNNTIDKLKGGKEVKFDADTTEADSKTKHLNDTIKQLAKNSPVIDPKVNDGQANEKLSLLQRAINRVKGSGSSLTKSFVFGNLIANGINTISGDLATWAKQGFEAAKAGAETAERWKAVGMTAPEVKQTGAAVKELKENSNLSGAAVGNLVTRMYGLTGSTNRAIALSKGVATITDQLKLSNQASDAFANGLTRIESSGKVTSQSLGRLEKQAPGLTTALQKASGMSKQAFNDLLSSGKMTSDQFNDILEKASKNWNETSKDWDKSPDNALHNIQTTWDDTKKALMAPLVSVAGTGLDSLSNSLNKLQPLFTKVGQGLANLTTKFAKWLTPQHATDLAKIVGDLGKMALIIGKGAWKAFSIIIEAIAKPFELIGRHGSKSADAFDKLADALDAISKNKLAMTALEGIGAVLATQFVYGKLFKIASGLLKIDGALGKISGVKFSGHLFSDLFTNLGRLSHVHGLSAGKEWLSGFVSKLGKGNFSLKNFFVGAPKDASIAGDLTGSTFISRFAQKTRAGRFAELGRGLAGKLGAGITIGLSAVDVARGLTPSFKGDRWKEVGKGAGGLIGGGIGMYFAGPAGAALGSMIGNVVGGWLGKAAHKGFNFMRDVFHGRITFSGIEHGFAQTMSKVGKWAQDTWKRIKDWWNQDPTKEGREKASRKEPSQHEIKSLGGNHYSKADIANIKQMNAAVKAYTSTLRTLKSTIKKNDPTKELNSMNKSLKLSAKYWLAVSKPIKQASKSFQGMRRPLETISRSMKELTGKKSGLGTFDKDLTKLEKDLRRSKIGEEFTKLSKQIKKSDLVKTLQKLTKEIRESVKYWKEFAKPVKQTTSEFQKFNKELKPFNGKNNPLDRLQKSIENLAKSLKKDRFGDELAKQMRVANKSMSGRGSVESKFTSMTRTIERDLSRFRSSFDRDWQRTWNDLTDAPSRSLSRVQSVVSNRFNAIVGRERSFTSKFLNGWRSWNSSVVSEMRSAFSKLPGIAQQAMSGIVSRLNRGISAINGVISDFGGDKHLSTIHYARGTFAHPGGKAIVNDGPEPNKTELIWQPSKGWGTAQGQNVVRDLEPGAMVLDAKRSQPYLAQGIFPHYASGTLSDAEQDKISEEFINNPIQASKNLVLKLTNWNSNVPVIADLGKATAIGFSRGIANVLKDLLGIIKEPINGDWTPVIKSAARMMHVSLSAGQIGKLLRQIQTESGGNEKISQQISDINSAEGHPAQGLLQFIPSTFNTWALPGHHNILSGFDQIMAAINALNHGGEGGWGNIGNGHGWASGVHMTHRDYALIGDNAEQDEYVINPYNANALPLLKDAYQTMSNNHPEWRTPTANAVGQEAIALLKLAVEKLDNIDIHPYTTVEEVARPVNKYNAKNYILRS